MPSPGPDHLSATCFRELLAGFKPMMSYLIFSMLERAGEQTWNSDKYISVPQSGTYTVNIFEAVNNPEVV